MNSAAIWLTTGVRSPTFTVDGREGGQLREASGAVRSRQECRFGGSRAFAVAYPFTYTQPFP